MFAVYVICPKTHVLIWKLIVWNSKGSALFHVNMVFDSVPFGVKFYQFYSGFRRYSDQSRNSVMSYVHWKRWNMTPDAMQPNHWMFWSTFYWILPKNTTIQSWTNGSTRSCYTIIPLITQMLKLESKDLCGFVNQEFEQQRNISFKDLCTKADLYFQSYCCFPAQASASQVMDFTSQSCCNISPPENQDITPAKHMIHK
jgi:hypothetical protein